MIQDYKLPQSFKFYFFGNYIMLKGRNGTLLIKLPPFYFSRHNKCSYTFMLVNYSYYRGFLSSITTALKNLYLYNFFKLRLKGLGFRVRKISQCLYKFFFTSTIFIICICQNVS